MDYNQGEIASKDYKLGETSTLHVSVRSIEGRLYLDARKWFKYPNQEAPISSRKGLMLDFETWDKVIPIIQELRAQCSA